MSVGVRRITIGLRIRTSSASTMNVYGRSSASLTIHMTLTLLVIASVEAFDDMLHVGSADDHLNVFLQNLSQHFFTFTIDTDHILEIHHTLSSPPAIACFPPLQPDVHRPLPAD